MPESLTYSRPTYSRKQQGSNRPHSRNGCTALQRVSIVIPTLNEERLLGSFLARFDEEVRKRFELEIVVSDGGSLDDTILIARSQADRVVVYEGSGMQTIAQGRNAGAACATGDILLFFNADTRLPVSMEDFLHDLTEAVTSSGAATCKIRVSPEQERYADRLVLGICNGLFRAMNVLGFGAGRGECHGVRRELFEKLGGYNEKLVAGEDFELFGRVARELKHVRGAGIRFLSRWTVYEDPRRYRKLGYVRTMSRWFLNFLSVTFLKKSHSRSWETIR